MKDYDSLAKEYGVAVQKITYNGFSSVISVPIYSSGLPEKQEGNYPAIITIHGLFGLQEMDVRLTAQLASLGYVSLVHGWQTEEHDPSDEDIISGIEKAIDYLCSLQNVDVNRIGLIGVCRGGSIAMISAARIHRLKAITAFYGQAYYPYRDLRKPFSPIELAKDVKTPLLVIHGEADAVFSVQESKDYCETLARYGKTYESYYYPGAEHGFFLQGHRNYHPEAAEDSWVKLKEFLKKNL